MALFAWTVASYGCSEPSVGAIPTVRAPRVVEPRAAGLGDPPRDPPRAVVASGDADAGAGGARVLLPLASRAQADESPREGWCGETAAQGGLLHLGAYVSQAAIHRAGHPSHADLYSHELPVALSALGVRFTRFPGGGYGAFVAWVREALGRSAPVLAGVKLLPTQHPEWGLDHFVLVVGEGEPGLLVDTTWGTREWSNDKKTRGISFVNAGYGLRFDGLELPRDLVASTPARLVVRKEDATTVSLRATCAAGGAGIGASRARIVCRKNPREVEAFLTTAADVSGSVDLDVPRAQSAWCACVGDP